MIVAPLIHTRTFSNDFDPNIKVVPKLFLDSDIKWARKSILEATQSIDMLQGERWVIIDNSKYRIAGVVGFLKDIYSKCHASEQSAEYEELFCDNKGRLVYAFIGVVIDKNQTNVFLPISYDYLWSNFVELIQPVWKKTYQEQIKADFTSYEPIEPLIDTDFNIPEIYLIGNRELYESSPTSDYHLFTQYLRDRSKNNFSLCTNMNDISMVKNCGFSVLTTSLNTITRIKRSMPASSPNTLNFSRQNHHSDDTSLKGNSNQNNHLKKNLLFLIIPLCLMILLIVILIALL